MHPGTDGEGFQNQNTIVFFIQDSILCERDKQNQYAKPEDSEARWGLGVDGGARLCRHAFDYR